MQETDLRGNEEHLGIAEEGMEKEGEYRGLVEEEMKKWRREEFKREGEERRTVGWRGERKRDFVIQK